MPNADGATAFPVAGSVYAYAGRGIGSWAWFLAGWALILDYLLIPTLLYVTGDNPQSIVSVSATDGSTAHVIVAGAGAAAEAGAASLPSGGGGGPA